MAKILIIEDDNFLLEMLTKTSTQEGLDIKIAVDGEAGLANIKAEKFDLILLDLILPKLPGLELLKQLRDEGDNTPVIVLSNLYDKESIDLAKSLKIKDYIIKAQSTPKEIIEKVKTFLTNNNKTLS
ncbi:MAG: response regulator [Parcubacteria group bacterium]|nr:response regulator [Parcubacteria group bacterium]